jgi:hypothetical protein
MLDAGNIIPGHWILRFFAKNRESQPIDIAHFLFGQALRCYQSNEGKWWSADGKSLFEAIKRAALSEIKGKRHPHQRRLSWSTLKAAAAGLQAESEEIAACRNFAGLHDLVGRALENLHGAGEMLVYDLADRIAYYLDLAPDRIYLHRGTRVGAAHYLGRLPRKTKSIALSEVAGDYPGRTAREMEDIFCIFKKDLAAMRAR